MKRILAALAAACCLSAFASAASAETIDAKAFSCKELTDSLASKDKEDQYGATVILYWIHGYLRTDEQGTVVDFNNMLKAFEQTTDYCSKNPNIGVLTASQKFMGAAEANPGSDAIDLAIIKCGKVLESEGDDGQGLGQILMWLEGFHAADDEETVIDLDQFAEDAKDIGAYCAENRMVGFYTASEKIMGSDDEDAADADEGAASEDEK